MPFFLVELPDRPGVSNVVQGGAMVVVASDAADAKAAADAHFGQDTRGIFTAIGVATQLAEASDLSGYALHIDILDSSPVVEVSSEGVIGASAVAINAGGTGYTVDDILTVGGGSPDRACTLRVTSVSTGVIDGVEVVDPGDYTSDGSLPSNPVSVTGGTGGDDATFNLTETQNEYVNLFAGIVSELNATSVIANASVDASEGASGARLLTIASAGDGIGDKDAVVEVRKNGVAIPGLVGTVTDQGSAGAALTAALVASGSLVLPNVVDVLRRT